MSTLAIGLIFMIVGLAGSYISLKALTELTHDELDEQIEEFFKK